MVPTSLSRSHSSTASYSHPIAGPKAAPQTPTRPSSFISRRVCQIAASRRLRGWIVDVVSDLGRIHDIVALSTKCLRQLSLTAAVAVGIGRVEKVDAVVRVCGAQHRHRFVIGLLAPPTCGEGPGAEADLACPDVGSGELP